MVWISGPRISDQAFTHCCCKRLRTRHVLWRCPNHARGQRQIIKEEWNVDGVRCPEAALRNRRWPIDFIHPGAALRGTLGTSLSLDDLPWPGAKCSRRCKKNVGW